MARMRYNTLCQTGGNRNLYRDIYELMEAYVKEYGGAVPWARKLGIGQNTIQSLLKNRTMPLPDTLRAIAEFTGYDLLELHRLAYAPERAPRVESVSHLYEQLTPSRKRLVMEDVQAYLADQAFLVPLLKCAHCGAQLEDVVIGGEARYIDPNRECHHRPEYPLEELDAAVIGKLQEMVARGAGQVPEEAREAFEHILAGFGELPRHVLRAMLIAVVEEIVVDGEQQIVCK